MARLCIIVFTSSMLTRNWNSLTSSFADRANSSPRARKLTPLRGRENRESKLPVRTTAFRWTNKFLV